MVKPSLVETNVGLSKRERLYPTQGATTMSPRTGQKRERTAAWSGVDCAAMALHSPGSEPRTGLTIADSVPGDYTLPHPGPDAPNVLVIVLDDLGFGQLGCFGSDIATPNIDRLAAGGLRYTSFHVTSLCSPTRASLLTGRNHHAVGMGFLTDVPIGFPGYDGRIPSGTPTLPRVMTANGYSAYAVGKWHLAPRWDQSASGPFDRWPLGLGFERFYGFL